MGRGDLGGSLVRRPVPELPFRRPSEGRFLGFGAPATKVARFPELPSRPAGGRGGGGEEGAVEASGLAPYEGVVSSLTLFFFRKPASSCGDKGL
jgi:hypothetical protein